MQQRNKNEAERGKKGIKWTKWETGLPIIKKKRERSNLVPTSFVLISIDKHQFYILCSNLFQSPFLSPRWKIIIDSCSAAGAAAVDRSLFINLNNFIINPPAKRMTSSSNGVAFDLLQIYRTARTYPAAREQKYDKVAIIVSDDRPLSARFNYLLLYYFKLFDQRARMIGDEASIVKNLPRNLS